MTRILHWIVSVLILLLGLIHSAMTFTCMVFDQNALWFFGSGIAIVFASIFNFLALTTYASGNRIAAISVNLIMASMFIMAAVKVLLEVQVYLGIGLFALAALLTVKNKSQVFPKAPIG